MGKLIFIQKTKTSFRIPDIENRCDINVAGQNFSHHQFLCRQFSVNAIKQGMKDKPVILNMGTYQKCMKICYWGWV